jgi:glycosyltransferase involved in cell wall biosynthesis
MHCLKLARQYFDAQIVYSVADLHHVRLKAQAELDRDHAPDLMREAQRVALQELVAVLAADRVITHSQAEADQLRQIPSIMAQDKIRVIPWSVPCAPVRKSFAERSGLVFVGGFGHAPNVDAARWLVTDIMPLVWQEAPDIRCLLIGSGMSDALRRELQSPRVDVLGRVERLSDAFEQVRLTVAPLRFGAGLKDKVLRSMAAGLPCIGTSEAFTGMQELPAAITSICRRDSVPDLATAIVRLHRDETANASCSQAGLNFIRACYNETRVDALIREITAPALERFRAKAKAKSPACEVLQFAPAPGFTQADVAANAPGGERRIVFK